MITDVLFEQRCELATEKYNRIDQNRIESVDTVAIFCCPHMELQSQSIQVARVLCVLQHSKRSSFSPGL